MIWQEDVSNPIPMRRPLSPIGIELGHEEWSESMPGAVFSMIEKRIGLLDSVLNGTNLLSNRSFVDGRHRLEGRAAVVRKQIPD